MAAADRLIVVIPGDDVTHLITLPAPTGTSADTSVKLGAGLLQEGARVIATKAGVLCYRRPGRFFVLSSQRRYIPAVGDAVVGVVTDRNPDAYRVRLHASASALLPALAFDGASKRNKPNLQVGTVVYARVTAASGHMEPELSCEAGGTGPKKDWVTGESVFGELHDGCVFQVSTGLARRLAQPDSAVLCALGASLPFEVAVGLNGIIWVTAAKARHIIAISSAVARSEPLSDADAETLVESLLPVVLGAG